jgi:hypothetical protein
MRTHNLLSLVAISCAVWACASIVGISDAELDPELSGGSAGNDDGGAPGAGKSGSAGTGGQPAAEGGAGAGGEAGGASGDLCGIYCETVMRNCEGATQVYTSPEVCLRACAVLPQGVEGTEAGNTVACRLFHALQIDIIGEAAVQCPIAGPGGDGVCGENCEGFCTLRRGICESTLNLATCRTECAALEDPGGFSVAQDEGASVQCRLYHVSAATFGTGVHCPHAAGAPPCAAP